MKSIRVLNRESSMRWYLIMF
ncbi:hypothetical protein F383_33062 [Gossypium arboreum]|uniref:Uncharacterized protein n=1 Tax=Gossypium arboreum TaxID=29729 RepID=A0A0B0N0J3_GOSAR|nr:hypothetical protein F383_33062 [Gossypium arboreum]